MLYVVKGMFTMVVEADGAPEARRTAERILRNDGVKAFVLDAVEEETERKKRNKFNAKGRQAHERY